MQSRQLRTVPGAATLYLIDERHHCDECTDDNILAADGLFERTVVLAGVEGYEGGQEYDEYTRSFTEGRASGVISPDSDIGTYPRFANGLVAKGRAVVGVDCRGLSNEIQCDLTAVAEGAAKQKLAPEETRSLLLRETRNHQNQLRRSEHFVRTLYGEYMDRGLKGDLVLNCGAHHNDHIEQILGADGLLPKGWPNWNYIRLRSTKYPVSADSR